MDLSAVTLTGEILLTPTADRLNAEKLAPRILLPGSFVFFWQWG